MRADGTDLLQLTFDGENKDPDWSKKGDDAAAKSAAAGRE